MKKHILTLVALATASFSMAQSSFVLKDYNDNVIVNNQHIDVWDVATVVEMEYGLHSENTTNNSVSIGLKRYEIDVVTGSENYFCWHVCYSPTPAGDLPVWTAQDALVMDPDSVYSNFHAYHRPTGTTGVSEYRYVFYDKNNLDDTLSITFTFNASPVGIEDAVAKDKLAIYPNPVADVAHVAYNLPGKGEAKLALHNMLGSKVKEIKLNSNENKLNLSVVDLNPGVYFYTLIQDDKTIATKRLVVSGK